MTVKNLTVFPDIDLHFGSGINVIVGENGTGKSHLLKLAYSILAVSAEEGRKPVAAAPTKTLLQAKIAEKLVNVFRPESLGRLARRKQGRERCDISLNFEDVSQNIEIGFATNSKSEVSVDVVPAHWNSHAPVFLPTRELLTIYPNFISIYDGHYLEFEETWRDTCQLLGAPLQRGKKERSITSLLAPIEKAMGGEIELDRNGRFYLKNPNGRMEIPLVAEGLRKLGMLARLVATGSLTDKGYLFWDEPEANLNPRLIKQLAETILELSKTGIQIFFATHSLFLLRELEILLSKPGFKTIDARFFGLHSTESGVVIEQGKSIDEIGDITLLDEDLEQSTRFLAI